MVDLMALAECASRFVSAAELHGAVCGLAAGRMRGRQGPFAEDALVEALIALLGSESLEDGESLEDFVRASLSELFAEDMSFQPLLPGDDAPVAARVEAIAEWCGAFAAGYGACQAPAQGLAEDAQSEELLRDFVAISGARPEGQDDEESETAMMELREYAKVGALVLAYGALHDDGD